MLDFSKSFSLGGEGELQGFTLGNGRDLVELDWDFTNNDIRIAHGIVRFECLFFSRFGRRVVDAISSFL